LVLNGLERVGVRAFAGMTKGRRGNDGWAIRE
jgi:hypothetical protein